MNDINFEQYLGGDPMAILKSAQEKLRLEEEEKKRIAEAEQIKAYRLAALKRASEEDPLGAAQQMLGQTRNNDPLQQVMQRAATKTPLDDMAQVTPQEIERQMRERIWGAPAKSKIGKVGKGISDFLGAFSGLPQDFSKPAMEQFLKIQEQYRKERANDLTAMTQAARITSTDQNSTAKLYTELAKNQGKLNLDAIKAVDGTLKTDAYAKSVETDAAYKASLNENKKAELLLKAKQIANTIKNSFEYAKYKAELMSSGPEGRYMADLLRDNLLEYMQMEAGRNAASKGGGSRTTTRETQVKGTVIDQATGNSKIVTMPGQPLSTTTSMPPNPVGQAFMAQQPFSSPPAASGAAKSYMAGQTEAAPLPKVQTPKSNVTRFSASDNPVTSAAAPKARQGYTPVSIVKVRPPGMQEYDLGGPGTLGVSNEFKARKENISQLTDAANLVIEAFTSGAAQRVNGAANQPISATERVLGAKDELARKLTGASAGHSSANTEINDLINRFKDDPEAQKYLRSVQILSTKMLADYIKAVSGAQSAREEANRLSQLFPKISDPPEVVLQKSVELMHRIGTIEAILGAGLSPQDIAMSSPAREKLRKEKLNTLYNNINKAKLTRMSSGSADWKQFMPSAADLDFNRFLAETEEASGTKFKGVLFQGYDAAPTAREKLKSKVTPEDETDAAFRRALEKYRKGKKK